MRLTFKPARNSLETCELSTSYGKAPLAIRKKGIGSSDAAAAVGLSPYKSPLELWMEKAGRDAGLPTVNPDDDTSPMYWRTLLEPIVAAHYTRRTGNRVRRINAVLQHPSKPWMLANLDREVIGIPDVQILECKTAGLNGARPWKDGVPEYVQLQATCIWVAMMPPEEMPDTVNCDGSALSAAGVRRRLAAPPASG